MRISVIEGVISMVTRKMNLLYGYTMLLGGAVGAYGWYTGELSEARGLFFLGVLGSLLFFWKARQRGSD